MGKYPYAGLLSVIRRLNSNYNVAWVPMRTRPETLAERSLRFGNIINLSYKSQPKSELDINSLFISSTIPMEMQKVITNTMREHDGLLVSNPLNAALHVYCDLDKGKTKNALDRGQLVIYLFKSKIDPVFTKPEYATMFFPVDIEDVAEFEYSIPQLLKMYSSQRLTLKEQEQEQAENWLVDIERSFNQIKREIPGA